MEASDALNWAAGLTVVLGGGALGIKRLLTTWGRESANASGAAATNDIINSLRSELERTQQQSEFIATKYDELIRKVISLQKENIDLQQQINHLKLAIGRPPIQPDINI